MSLQIFFLWWEILRFTLWATFKYITQYCLLLHILYSHGLFILSQEGCTFWSPSSISPTLHCQWSPMFSVVFKISSISEMKWYLSFSNVSFGASLVAQTIKCLLTMRETQVRSLGQEDPLEKEMATHSSTLAWKIPWIEEHNRLQSMGSQRVGHDWFI